MLKSVFEFLHSSSLLGVNSRAISLHYFRENVRRITLFTAYECEAQGDGNLF